MRLPLMCSGELVVALCIWESRAEGITVDTMWGAWGTRVRLPIKMLYRSSTKRFRTRNNTSAKVVAVDRTQQDNWSNRVIKNTDRLYFSHGFALLAPM